MNPTLKTFLAILGGLLVGALVNGGLITISPSLVSPPEGVNPMDIESIKANLHLYQPKHFIIPFLAHALGTLVGAYIAARFSPSNFRRSALIVGVLFLAGGISVVLDLGGPMWFNALDLIVAYIPMAYLGWKLSGQPVS